MPEKQTGSFRTEQESFWAGQFGNEYIRRNQGDALRASNLALFARALRSTRGVKTCIEFGANIGLNLEALKLLLPAVEQHAIEINTNAVTMLANVVPAEHIFHGSILDFVPNRTWDLVLIKGVLIHISPEALTQVYNTLVASCGSYLILVEYYNPTPVTVLYRGHTDRLFKRDFAGEIMDLHPQMQLLDYGFGYRRDGNFPQDDANWFLMEKRTDKAFRL
jgi:spore coat polysaccharide biosynthesis protein SpsF